MNYQELLRKFREVQDQFPEGHMKNSLGSTIRSISNRAEAEGVDLGDVLDDFEEPEFSYETAGDTIRDIEDEVAYELGLYLDFSSIRYGMGTIFIFSDPEHENNCDVWIGDWGAELGAIDYEDYVTGVENEVLRYPESQWKAKYTHFLQSLI